MVGMICKIMTFRSIWLIKVHFHECPINIRPWFGKLQSAVCLLMFKDNILLGQMVWYYCVFQRATCSCCLLVSSVESSGTFPSACPARLLLYLQVSREWVGSEMKMRIWKPLHPALHRFRRNPTTGIWEWCWSNLGHHARHLLRFGLFSMTKSGEPFKF